MPIVQGLGYRTPYSIQDEEIEFSLGTIVANFLLLTSYFIFYFHSLVLLEVYP